ncbi:hypothetical protein [Arthrobacter sp. A5]|uniref:hypothetical protein n=1 Tax=Arthrobacter sp. A5 TaxID=576926 RepID=UPI003DAA0CDE
MLGASGFTDGAGRNVRRWPGNVLALAARLATITLTGEGLTTVDAFATAALAMGEEARD